MAFHLESAGQRLMLTADTANHSVWSLQRPDWEVRFDADKAAAFVNGIMPSDIAEKAVAEAPAAI